MLYAPIFACIVNGKSSLALPHNANYGMHYAIRTAGAHCLRAPGNKYVAWLLQWQSIYLATDVRLVTAVVDGPGPDLIRDQMKRLSGPKVCQEEKGEEVSQRWQKDHPGGSAGQAVRVV